MSKPHKQSISGEITDSNTTTIAETTATRLHSVCTHYYPQVWLLLLSILAIGALVARDRQLFNIITSLDRSYMASICMALVLIGSIHCGWHMLRNSQHIEQLQQWLEQPNDDRNHASKYINNYLDDLSGSRQHEARKNLPHTLANSPLDDSIVEIHANHIRSPVELGWFFVDMAVRLGLLGTIIGFILIFTSLSDLTITGGEDLKKLLIAMSGGMGTALLTTLTGLIAASALSFQYLILGRECEHQVGLLLRVRNLYQSQSEPLQ